jgi:hypothetical protein
MNLTNSWMSAATIPELTEDLIFRAWTWFKEVLETDPRQSAGAFALIEIMQPVRLTDDALDRMSVSSSRRPQLTTFVIAASVFVHSLSLGDSLAAHDEQTHPAARHRIISGLSRIRQIRTSGSRESTL